MALTVDYLIKNVPSQYSHTCRIQPVRLPFIVKIFYFYSSFIIKNGKNRFDGLNILSVFLINFRKLFFEICGGLFRSGDFSYRNGNFAESIISVMRISVDFNTAESESFDIFSGYSAVKNKFQSRINFSVLTDFFRYHGRNRNIMHFCFYDQYLFLLFLRHLFPRAADIHVNFRNIFPCTADIGMSARQFLINTADNHMPQRTFFRNLSVFVDCYI